MRTMGIVPTFISSQKLLQLCYPHILEGEYGNFRLSYNHKEQSGGDYDVPHNVPLYLITLNYNQLHLISVIMYEHL